MTQVFALKASSESAPTVPGSRAFQSRLFFGKSTFSFCQPYSLETGRLCRENAASFYTHKLEHKDCKGHTQCLSEERHQPVVFPDDNKFLSVLKNIQSRASISCLVSCASSECRKHV